MRCLHTLAVAGLAIAVTYLFWQVQALQTIVDNDQAAVEALREQVQTQQHEEIQQLSEEVKQEQSNSLYQAAGTFTILTCLLTMFHMSTHLQNMHEPMVQRKIITILWMSPIYGVTSFLSLIFPCKCIFFVFGCVRRTYLRRNHSLSSYSLSCSLLSLFAIELILAADGYLAVIKDFYEAYVVYTFLSFLIAVLGRGNREVAVDVLSNHAEHLKQPTRCLKRFYHPPPETSNRAKAAAVIMECMILAMQFVFIRPLTSIARFVSTDLWEKYHPPSDEGGWQAYVMTPAFVCAMITNVSVFLAFTGLVKFYHAVREELTWCSPFWKFMAIKGIVFLTFWQGLLITILVELRNDGTSTSDTFGYGNDTTSPIYYNSTNSNGGSDNGDSEFGGNIAFTPTHSPTHSPTITAPDWYNNNNHNRTRFLFPRTLETSDEEVKSSRQEAQEIQNALICFEMLLFSIAHWCVFPHEEWAEGYRPKEGASVAGIGLKDFVSDMSYIVSSRSENRAHRRRRKRAAKGAIGDGTTELTLVDSHTAPTPDGEGSYSSSHNDDSFDTKGDDVRVYEYNLSGSDAANQQSYSSYGTEEDCELASSNNNNVDPLGGEDVKNTYDFDNDFEGDFDDFEKVSQPQSSSNELPYRGRQLD